MKKKSCNRLNKIGFEVFQVSFSGLRPMLGSWKNRPELVSLLEFFELYLSLVNPEFFSPVEPCKKFAGFDKILGQAASGIGLFTVSLLVWVPVLALSKSKSLV